MLKVGACIIIAMAMLAVVQEHAEDAPDALTSAGLLIVFWMLMGQPCIELVNEARVSGIDPLRDGIFLLTSTFILVAYIAVALFAAPIILELAANLTGIDWNGMNAYLYAGVGIVLVVYIVSMAIVYLNALKEFTK